MAEAIKLLITSMSRKNNCYARMKEKGSTFFMRTFWNLTRKKKYKYKYKNIFFSLMRWIMFHYSS